MFNFVFVVLVYRNYNDVEDFLQSLSNVKGSTKVLIVNSYFDDESMNKIKKIAFENNCDFINIENKGYGYGNNKGIEYSIENYEFDYLVVSNPDILIKRLDFSELSELGNNCIVGPKIICKTNKNQNPHYYKKYWPVFQLTKLFVNSKNILFLYLSLIINKIRRYISNAVAFFYTRFFNTSNIKVYALHGSFIIFPKEVLNKIEVMFDEKMFLFCEENHIAENCKHHKIPSFYCSNFEVYHKEDGSMQYLNESVKNHTYNSLKIFFNNWG